MELSILADRLLRSATNHGMGQHLLLLSVSDILTYRKVRFPASLGPSLSCILEGFVGYYTGLTTAARAGPR